MKKMRPMDCGADDCSSDDEISVGCPSPQLQTGDQMDDEHDLPHKKVTPTTKEILNNLTSQRIRPDEMADNTSSDATKNPTGVRSFSILDILNHRPSAIQPSSQQRTTPELSPPVSSSKLRRKSANNAEHPGSVDSPHHPTGMLHPSDADSPSKIMRPWDYPHLSLPAHFQAAAAAAAGFLNPNRCLPFVAHPASSPFLPSPHPFGLGSHPAAGLGFHHPHHASFHPHHHHHHLHQQQQQQQQQRAAAGSAFVGGILSIGGSSSGHLSPSSSSASPDYISAGGSSDCDADDVCSTSGNSATSDGSPLLQQQQRQKTLLNSGSLVVKNNNNNNNSSASGSVRKSSSSSGVKKSSGDSGKAAAANTAGGHTPLDALFQMTSKTFDGSSNNGADSSGSQTGSGHGGGGGGGGSGALFSPRQQAKKKRKSRTAFTNHQIFELEKRFLYQKYLSPADRDEIALTLGLTNAQVITWFQNRRAKLKRDMEELKKDVESAKILGSHHHHHHHHHKAFIGAMDLNLLQKKADEYNQAMAAASD